MATLLFISGVAAGASEWKLATGLGLEGRREAEVNPGYSDWRAQGQLFEVVQLHPWGAAFEFGYDQQDSSSGAYHISTHTASLGLWGRYAFLSDDAFSPYAAVGLGSAFDKITSTYLSSQDVRHGSRGFAGTGAGVSKVFWQTILTEVELRGEWSQDRTQPTVSVLLRAGVML
jgi:hypothetical protein